MEFQSRRKISLEHVNTTKCWHGKEYQDDKHLQTSLLSDVIKIPLSPLVYKHTNALTLN